MKIALGYDCHQIKESKNQNIVIAGCKIPVDYTVVAHSDGDVVYHALADAISSVFLNKSIGEIFPDTASENKNRDSSEFVKEIYNLASKPKIINADIIVIAQSPIIAKYKDQMQNNIASLLFTSPDKISIRGKRREDDIKKISCMLTILFE